MLACLPVPSFTSSSSGLAARAKRRTLPRGQAQISGDLRLAAALGQQAVHVGVPGPGGDPSGSRQLRDAGSQGGSADGFWTDTAAARCSRCRLTAHSTASARLSLIAHPKTVRTHGKVPFTCDNRVFDAPGSEAWTSRAEADGAEFLLEACRDPALHSKDDMF